MFMFFWTQHVNIQTWWWEKNVNLHWEPIYRAQKDLQFKIVDLHKAGKSYNSMVDCLQMEKVQDFCTLPNGMVIQ